MIFLASQLFVEITSGPLDMSAQGIFCCSCRLSTNSYQRGIEFILALQILGEDISLYRLLFSKNSFRVLRLLLLQNITSEIKKNRKLFCLDSLLPIQDLPEHLQMGLGIHDRVYLNTFVDA